MKYKKMTSFIFVVVVAIVSGCGQTKTKTGDELQLQEFVIGSWKGRYQVSTLYENYWEEYRLIFIDEDTLRFSMSSPVNDFDAYFSYKFINDQTLLVENERSKGDSWKISKSEDLLLICRGPDSTKCVEYYRDE